MFKKIAIAAALIASTTSVVAEEVPMSTKIQTAAIRMAQYNVCAQSEGFEVEWEMAQVDMIDAMGKYAPVYEKLLRKELQSVLPSGHAVKFMAKRNQMTEEEYIGERLESLCGGSKMTDFYPVAVEWLIGEIKSK